MSEVNRPEEPIVIHGPITGAPDRLDEVSRPPAPKPRRRRPPRGPDGRFGRANPQQPVTTTAVDVVPATITPVPRAQTPAAVSVAPPPQERAFGLDGFRGLLLLAMTFAFTIPHWGPFPTWMYHMQVPPGETAEYVRIAGITWRDTLFPGFLFTMSAALPITMGARLAKGMPYPEIAWIAMRRGFLLLLFALIIGHVNPYWTQDYTKRGNVIAITGLLVAFVFFLRPSRNWNPAFVKWLRYSAWAGVAAVLFLVPTLYGQTFSMDRRDGIISAIAFATVAGTIVWLLTRERPMLRVAILGVLLLGRTAAQHVEWIGALWYSTPATWLYQAWYLELMFLVIPGTIAGDLVLRWMKRAPEKRAHASPLWPKRRLATIAVIGFGFLPIILVGLFERRYPGPAAALIVATAAALLFLSRDPASERDRVISHMYSWAALWLIAGVLLEPFEGGIKKDPQTLGYLLLMAGSAVAGLGSLLIIFDGFQAGKRVLRPLVDVGQNPLFAYVVYTLGITHVLWLFGRGDLLTANWQQATLRGFLLTGVAGFVVWLATKKRLLWRA